MRINICKTCKKEFTRPTNPQREYKYCSCSCMGKDKEKTEKHGLLMKGRSAWNKGIKGLQSWHNISGFIGGWNKGLSNENWKGEKNPNWNGGVTPENEKIRKSIEYKEWRMNVLRRDHFKCINCGHKGNGKYKDLIVDHIKPFSKYPELRMSLGNGRTLCSKCDDLLGWKYQKNRKLAVLNNI